MITIPTIIILKNSSKGALEPSHVTFTAAKSILRVAKNLNMYVKGVKSTLKMGTCKILDNCWIASSMTFAKGKLSFSPRHIIMALKKMLDIVPTNIIIVEKIRTKKPMIKKLHAFKMR